LGSAFLTFQIICHYLFVQACPKGEERWFDYETDATIRECAAFEAVSYDSSLASMMAFTEARGSCPCKGDTAVVACETKPTYCGEVMVSPFMTDEQTVIYCERSRAYYDIDLQEHPYGAPVFTECQSAETLAPVAEVEVCGDSSYFLGYDVYEQYCATNVDSVRQATQAAWAEYNSDLKAFAAVVEMQRANLMNASPETILSNTYSALYNLDSPKMESIPCLEGCATFIAQGCCGNGGNERDKRQRYLAPSRRVRK
jgi:hypothetical protein